MRAHPSITFTQKGVRRLKKKKKKDQYSGRMWMLKRMVRGWMGGNFHLWTSTKTKNNNIHFLLLSSLDGASTNFKNWFKLNAASICDSVRVSLK